MATIGGLILGVLVGIVSGMVGIGGGALIIPALVFGFGMSQHKAQGTSLAIMLLPTGALAFWKYWQSGEVDIRFAILISLGFLLGGWLGGSWAIHLSDVALRRGFALLLIVVAIRMLFK